MTTERRSDWLNNLRRFTLGDLAILVGVVVFLISPHPDTEARASIASAVSNIEKKQDKVAADANQQVLLGKIELVSKQLVTSQESQDRLEKDLKERLERLEKKIDQTSR